jgi:hypothetical protein
VVLLPFPYLGLIRNDIPSEFGLERRWVDVLAWEIRIILIEASWFIAVVIAFYVPFFHTSLQVK